MSEETTNVRKHPYAKCEECPLADRAHKPAYASVPTNGKASLALVGEAPGRNEARQGTVFVGVSGRLLGTVMDHYGISRREVLLTNACLCRPADGSTPPKQAVEACNPRLLAELQEYGSEVVVALGNTATQALMDTRTGITTLRVGPGRSSYKLPGVRIIPTIHPAACLRNPDSFPNLVADFAKISAPASQWREPIYTVADDEQSALQLIELVNLRTDRVVVDIEVGIEKDGSFDHPNMYEYLCVGIGYEKGKVLVIGEEALKSTRVWDTLRQVLSRKKIIAHNGKFDLAGLYRITKGEAKLWFDTMLAHYALDERSGIHGLKYLAVEELGAPQYDDEIKRYVGPRDSYAVVPRDVLYKYNAFDCSCTWDLYELFETRMEQEDVRRVHDFLVSASNELMYVELNGLAVDRRYLGELTHRYLDILTDIEKELEGIVGRPFNPRSPKQIKEILQELKVDTDSTDEDHLKAISEAAVKGNQVQLLSFVETLLKHRREQKLYGTYVKGTAKRLYGGRVYPTFLLHGTTTGRLACRNPNLQNVPRESSIRRLFVPSKDENVFVSADYGQAELRVITFLARDEYFRGIFNDPSRDLFDELTPILYPSAIKPESTASVEEKAAWKELRIRVKAYVYGLSYGREHYSIAQEFKISEREAKAGMDRFFEVIPGIVAWRKSIEDAVRNSVDLVSPFGRHRRFWLVTDDNRKDITKEALAFLPQSTASDICLSAAVELRQRLRGRAFVRLLVHDNIMVECASDLAHSVGAEMNEVMLRKAADIVGDYVAFKTDVTIGRSWGAL